MATTRLGLDENIEAALAYLLTFLTGVLFYIMEDNEFVRFHAVQSIIVFGALFVVSMALGVLSTIIFPVPGIGQMIAAILGTISFILAPLSFALWIYLMYRAYSGDRYHVPLAGPYAERYA